jgi:L-ascorbate metabolism protein UlaG (beta-lactamase superfamily)
VVKKNLNYRSNPSLKTIKPDWPGTPVDSNNRFVNLEFPFIPKFRDVFKWMMSRNPQRKEKKEDTFRLKRVTDASFLTNPQDCIVWLGHATFFIRLSGVNVLVDPVFFDVSFLKRYSAHAYDAATFKNLDYLLISHDHQDHCQEKSIRQIVDQNPGLKILTGLNMEMLLRPWCKNLSIEMAGWYQQYKTNPNAEIYFLPSRHWSKRGLSDENKRLWGSFIIRSRDKTIYFSGDTGYGNHFKEVKELFGKITVAIIGIGAYKPEWFMHPNHVSPQDAVKGFHEVGAKIFIPMHYGTFDISDEPIGEPLRIVEALERENKIQGKVKALSLGECFGEF